MSETARESSIVDACAAIELLVLDVDGVMTDGSIYVDDNGLETKVFHVRDGAGIAYWKRLGKRVVIISGRTCRAVAHRAAELGIERVYQGRLDKRTVLQEVLSLEGLAARQACMIGDDLADIPALRLAGVAVAVGDAVSEVKSVAHYITVQPGGRGAVREVIEWLLRAQGQWSGIAQSYEGS
jgi:3-deoxy-D-manno-octulosonate 8-phosphate phosphatase (KDO 8-P phosphatase)